VELKIVDVELANGVLINVPTALLLLFVIYLQLVDVNALLVRLFALLLFIEFILPFILAVMLLFFEFCNVLLSFFIPFDLFMDFLVFFNDFC
jgi:hypothetical protein